MLPESYEKRAIDLLFQATEINPYNTEIWYEIARRYGTDLNKINQLVERIKTRVGTPDESVEFEEEKSTDTDFSAIENNLAHMPITDVKKTAKGYATTMYMAIVQNAYKKAHEKNKENGKLTELGYAFLKEEYAAQDALKKSPFKAYLAELLLKYAIEVRGFDKIKEEATAEILAQIQGMKKFGSLNKKKEIRAQIEILVNHIEDRDQRVAWLQTFRDAYKDGFVFKAPKPGKEDVQVDGLYDFLVKQQSKALRGKKPRKAGNSESKKLLEDYEAMKASFKVASTDETEKT